MTWPKKPAGVQEHDWYRLIEGDLALSVISADPNDSPCGGCGQRRVIYQAQVFADRHIVARCQDCLVSLAGAPAKLWVRSDVRLRQKWERDGKDPRRQEQARRARQRSPTGIEGWSDGSEEG